MAQLARGLEGPGAVRLGATLAVEPGPAMGQGERHQARGVEANRGGVVQRVPRLQRPCVDDDPW